MEKKKKKIDLKEEICMFIDSSALKNMFEGKNKEHSDDLLKKMKEIKDMGGKFKAITTLSSFLRAIFLADSNVQINKIQKTLSFLEVMPSFADFKNEEAVRNEVIELAKILSRKSHNRT